jgi:hypothetical protein
VPLEGPAFGAGVDGRLVPLSRCNTTLAVRESTHHVDDWSLGQHNHRLLPIDPMHIVIEQKGQYNS